jgi:hypothetical protein
VEFIKLVIFNCGNFEIVASFHEGQLFWSIGFDAPVANLLILGGRTDPGFITTLNKMLWFATGASKPMDQKSCPS